MRHFRKRLVVHALLSIGLCSSVVAQNKYWREIKGKPLIKFDWNCTLPETLPKSSLSRLIKIALRGEDPAPGYYADRAFAYDLNLDGKPEYFVPLDCGATGNCSFGLLRLSPQTFLGKVHGQYVYVHERPGGWPDLITYTHFSAAEGILTTYTFKRGRYKQVGGYPRTDDRGGIFGNKVPAFLERARKACERVGY